MICIVLGWGCVLGLVKLLIGCGDCGLWVDWRCWFIGEVCGYWFGELVIRVLWDVWYDF